MNDTAKQPTPRIRVPETPNWLITLALMCVPGVYIVLLLSAALVIGIGGGLLWMVFKIVAATHRINMPILVLMIGLGCGVAMGTFAVIKGVIGTIWRRPDFQPALIVNPTKEPNLGRFLVQLCSKLGTSMPDCVLLHAEPTFFVTQGKIATFDGIAKGRILAIGLPCLGGLTVNELRSVLSHEFAHFTGKDTTYSSMVLPVYSGTSTAWISMQDSIASQAESNDSALMTYSAIIPMLLPRYMLMAYLYIFHLLNMKISRTREFRADAIAVNTCGSRCFEKALVKAHALGGLFADDEANEVIRRIGTDQRIGNRFHAFRSALPHLSAKGSAFAKLAYDRPQDKHDSHPSLKNRVKAMGNVPEQFQDLDQCTTLFTNLESYESMLHKNLAELMSLMDRS
ncbi:MAG TPA: M48 family metallopeptidase [Armatimonadota bacterium]|jgi:Zn-dependent protease with chaperone function